MNINIFFVLIISGLLAIFFLFEPIKIKKSEAKETPLLQLGEFELSELNHQGLKSIMKGSSGLRYKDRYIVDNLDYTENENEYRSNIKAKNGIHKGVLLNLSGNVVYTRVDGLSFKSQKASYNQKTKIVISPTKYISYMGDNEVRGSYVKYNNITQIVKSKNVTVKYNLKDK